jgi:hypothetical protein
MKLTVCSKCTSHIFSYEKECPHCGALRNRSSYTGKRATLTLLLGLATMTACGEDSKTDSTEPETEPAEEPAVEPAEDQAAYGIPDIDEDDDGWTNYEDCDDNDSNTFPGSAETDSTTECMTDADGDGYGDINAQAPAVPGTDCDDSNADIHPAATEAVGDGVDSNCNGDNDN